MAGKSRIGGLGEIALRVNDLDGMERFYTEVVGLELLRRFDNAAFFKIADGYGGHTQVLVLFDRSAQADYIAPSARATTIDHIAFEIDLVDFAREKARLEEAGATIRTAEHAWTQWRSLYLDDPEGNTVEFVCFDASVR
jgi:catechol-2,3-dioxygenase